MFPTDTPGPPPTTPTGAAVGRGANSRYAYLIGRLRNRQITMEEATELFSIMTAMLRASDEQLAAIVRAREPGRTLPPPPAPRAPVAPGSLTGIPDELIWMGLLALGAGAGLFAATTKKLGEASGPAAPLPARPRRGASSP